MQQNILGNSFMIHAQLINDCDQLIQNVTVVQLEILTYNQKRNQVSTPSEYLDKFTALSVCFILYFKFFAGDKCTKPQFLLWVEFKCELGKSVTPRVSPSALKFFNKCLEIAHFCRRPFQPSAVGHSHQLVLTKICSFA